MHEENCFLTLTYAPEHLPANGSLNPDDTTRFIKRLRSRISPRKISYFYCGEYGDNFDRPHYHFLIFGYEFPDRRKSKLSKSGHPSYTSALLDELWGLGRCDIGALNFETAAYTARYCCKKITGDAASAHYDGKLPEFANMSTKPAIGARYFAEYSDQIYRHDRLVVRDVEQRPPRYYDKLLRRVDPDKLDAIKKLRTVNSAATSPILPVQGKKNLTTDQRREKQYNRSKSRLKTVEEVTTLRSNFYKRNL